MGGTLGPGGAQAVALDPFPPCWSEVSRETTHLLEIWAENLFTRSGRPEFGEVLLAHALQEFETLGPIGGDPGDDQHRCGRVTPSIWSRATSSVADGCRWA